MPLELVEERRRLCALARYEIVDTPPEEAFDRIVRLAASLFRAPIALISFVAEDRLFFKAEIGLHTRYAPRAASFCDHAIGGRQPCLISDAAQHPSFADHPFVVGVPGIRFYAGAMLRTKDGYNLGTLCVIDTEPRPDITDEDQRHLEDLAAVVMEHLELRAKTAVARALASLSREKPGRSARPSRAAGPVADSRDQVVAEGHRLITDAYRDSHLMAHRGQDLVRAGEPCERVLLMYTGWACRYRLMANGTRQILDILLPGNLIGIDGLFSTETPSAVMALTDVTYGSVPCSDLWSLFQQQAAGIQMALAVMEQQLRSDLTRT